MENKEDKNSLEERAKKFLKLRIETDPRNNGFNPVQIDNYYEYAPAINYLLEKNYLVEKDFTREEDKTVKSVLYIWTNSGKVWAFI